MKIHARTIIVNNAKIELTKCWLDLFQKHELTTAEMLSVLSQFSHEQIGGIAKFAIREERHGNTDEPGDVE